MNNKTTLWNKSTIYKYRHKFLLASLYWKTTKYRVQPERDQVTRKDQERAENGKKLTKINVLLWVIFLLLIYNPKYHFFEKFNRCWLTCLFIIYHVTRLNLNATYILVFMQNFNPNYFKDNLNKINYVICLKNN